MDEDIALCISGQMRTFRKCYGYLYENIIQVLDPDIFVHVWEKTGITTNARFVNDIENDTVTHETLESLYSPESAVIENFEQKYHTELDGVRIPRQLKKDSEGWKGNIPMFYKMKKCNDLKSEVEREHGFRYDFVIRIRPDLMVTEPIPEKVFENEEIVWYLNNDTKAGQSISDQFAISSSANMDYYTSVWNHLNKYWENPMGNEESKWSVRIGERLMQHHMAQSDTITEPLDVQYGILRQRDFIENNSNLIAAYRLLKKEGATELSKRLFKRLFL